MRRARSAWAAAAIALALLAATGPLSDGARRASAQSDADPAAEAPAQSARVVHADGRTSTLTLKQLALPSREWYVAGSGLADALQVGRYWRTDVRKLVLRVGEQRITFTVGARAVVATDATLMLRSEVLFHQGEPWIPLEFLTRVLGQITDRAVQWDEEKFILSLGEKQFNVTGFRVEAEDLHTELHISMSAPLAFRVDDSRARVLSLKIYGGQADPMAMRLSTPRGLIESIRPIHQPNALLLEIHLSELASRYQSLAANDGKTIVLRVEQAPISTIPEPVPRGPHLVQTLPPEAKGRRVQVRRVIVDPGHGGADVGRQGVNGLLEKDVALAISLELKRVLERRDDLEVVLTREQDQAVGLVERTELANREGGDLLISIHLNGWYDAAAEGVETYFLSPAKTEWDASVARAENASVAAAEDLDFILWDLVQNVYIQESATLAEAVQARLSSDLGLHNRGVKQAGFRVLVGAFMPAILVEVGFLSNPGDAKRLADRDFHRDVARALADAVLDFRARMDAVREESR